MSAKSDSFRRYLAKIKAEHAARMATYPPEEGTAFAIFRSKDNPQSQKWLHRSTYQPGGWRVTHVSLDPRWAAMPMSGHEEYDTFQKALDDLAAHGAAFVSRNEEPKLPDPSETFKEWSSEQIEQDRKRTIEDMEQDRKRGGYNLATLSTSLFAIEQELRRRGRARKDFKLGSAPLRGLRVKAPCRWRLAEGDPSDPRDYRARVFAFVCESKTRRRSAVVTPYGPGMYLWAAACGGREIDGGRARSLESAQQRAEEALESCGRTRR